MTNTETKKQRLCEMYGWTKVCPNLCFEMCVDKHTDRCKFYKKPDETPEQIIIRLKDEVDRLRSALEIAKTELKSLSLECCHGKYDSCGTADNMAVYAEDVLDDIEKVLKDEKENQNE